MRRLDGKVALISGAARGQGEAEARAFVREGARVVLADVLDKEGRQVAEELGDRAVYAHLDVQRPDDWAAAVRTATSRFGKLDVLVNNAGILRVATIEQMPLEEYLQVVWINQVGCFLGMQAAVAALRAAGGGSIINTSSTSGLTGIAGTVAYTASKFAVRGMTKSAAIELGPDNIRVNSVHPGAIDTPMTAAPPGFDDVDSDAVYAGLPLPRIGQPEEVAALAVFLASDESSYCTGSEFVVDGGFLAGPPLPKSQ
ncbi:glucose 1-dehydrogenase [Streptomyces sp. NPDC005480]|uniref:glucose 1-dehydrogenase n=1 Tax=Streptomyces sp. NPDC005480 TaxID=3154880 RepID=UPI0033A38208